MRDHSNGNRADSKDNLEGPPPPSASPAPSHWPDWTRGGLTLINCRVVGQVGPLISVPAGTPVHVNGLEADGNWGPIIHVRDEQNDFLATLHLRPDTPIEVIAAAVRALQQVSVNDEQSFSEVLTSTGLRNWIIGTAPQVAQFVSNLLALASTPQGQDLIGKLAA